VRKHGFHLGNVGPLVLARARSKVWRLHNPERIGLRGGLRYAGHNRKKVEAELVQRTRRIVDACLDAAVADRRQLLVGLIANENNDWRQSLQLAVVLPRPARGKVRPAPLLFVILTDPRRSCGRASRHAAHTAKLAGHDGCAQGRVQIDNAERKQYCRDDEATSSAAPRGREQAATPTRLLLLLLVKPCI
jgi:hypothetical protein